MELAHIRSLRERIEGFLCYIDDLTDNEDDPNKAIMPDIRQEAEDLIQEGRKFGIIVDAYFEAGMERRSWGNVSFEEEDFDGEGRFEEGDLDDGEDESDTATKERENKDKALLAEEIYYIAELTRPIEEAAQELTNIAIDLKNLEICIEEEDSAA